MRDTFTLNVGDSGNWFGFGGALLPGRRTYNVPDLESLGLQGSSAAADALHEMGRALAANLTVFADDRDEFETHFPHQRFGSWLEVARLCESAGNGLELVGAALCETAGMLSADGPDRDPLSPALAAFIIEAAIQYLISTGHNLTNVAFRACIEDPACRDLLEAGTRTIRSAVRGVVSGTRDGWLYHSQAQVLADLLDGVERPSAQCLRVTRDLYTAQPWQAVSRARNDYFHRWRHGFRDTGPEPHRAAEALHSAAVNAAACIARALPPFYHRLTEAFPISPVNQAALMGPILVTEGNSEEFRPLLPDVAFCDRHDTLPDIRP